MNNILTLSGINESDILKIGERAFDLSQIHKGKFNVPLTFIVPNLLFHEFLYQNKLTLEIRKLLNLPEGAPDKFENAYARIKTLFEFAVIPEEFHEELLEAYETLQQSSNSNAQALLDQTEPLANLIISPSYSWKQQNFSGVLLNIHNFDNFLNAIKSCWLALYSPEHLKLREKNNIQEFTAGIIVQQFVTADYTLDSFSKSLLGNYEISMDAYLGLPDITGKLSKDSYSISRETFGIEHQEIRNQESLLLKNNKSGTLIRRNLGKKGTLQKIPDKNIFDAARLVDRISTITNKHLRIVFQSASDKQYVFFADRICERNAEQERSERPENKTSNESTSNSQNNSKETLSDIINSPITEDEGDVKQKSTSTDAFAWESTLPSNSNPLTSNPVKAINSSDWKSETKETEHNEEARQQEDLLKDETSTEPAENLDDFIMAPSVESVHIDEQKQNAFIEEEVKIEKKAKEDEINPIPLGPDNEFFMSIILDLEPGIDQEILKRYQTKFGEVPEDITVAAEKLEEEGSLPEKEQIFKLKNMKALLQKGETINLDCFLDVTEKLRRLF